MLSAYLDLLHGHGPPEEPALAGAIACHLADLVALALREAASFAAPWPGPGKRAIRLAAAKGWALDRLRDPGLTIRRVAAVQRVSPRYIQALFREDGTTFTSFLRAHRLALVRRQLADPLLVAKPVGAIAFDSGFSDLSYFNRTFRAAFGETPSDFRHHFLRKWRR